jgi:precorrin-4 methylase
MGVAEALRIETSLARLALADHVRVEIVSDAQMPGQRVLRCAANEIAQTLRDNGIKNRSIIFLSLPRGCATQNERPNPPLVV